VQNEYVLKVNNWFSALILQAQDMYIFKNFKGANEVHKKVNSQQLLCRGAV
jgi:hypothetical protein